MLIPVLLLVVGVVAALLAPRSRFSYWFLISLLVLLMGGNLDNPDRLAYLESYAYTPQDGGDPNFEPGYQLLVRLGGMLGLSYGVFNALLIIGGLLLVGSTVRLFSARPALVLVMYATYPMFWDYVQIRNFLAMAVLTYAARYLIGREKYVLRYLFGVAIASSMHISSVIFLLMPLVCIRKRGVFYAIASAVVGAYLLALDYLLANPIFAFLVHKIETYTVTETSDMTKVGVIGIYLASCALIFFCVSVIEDLHRRSSTPLAGGHRARIESIDTTVVARMFVLSVVFLPLATINLDFLRLFRNMFVTSALVFDAALLASATRSLRLALRVCIGLYLGICFGALVWFVSLSDVITPLFSTHFLSTN